MPLKNKQVFEKLKNIPTSIISDVLSRFQVMEQELKPSTG